MRRLRFILALLLVSAPVAIALATSGLVKARTIDLPPRPQVIPTWPIEVGHVVQPARTARVTVLLRSTVRGIEVSAEYAVTADRRDPLVRGVRTGDIDGRALAGLAGGPAWWAYTTPTVELSGTAASLLVSSRPTPVHGWTYIEDPRASVVHDRTLSVRGDGVPIIRMQGAEPVSQRPDHAEFIGRPQDYVRVWVSSDESAGQAGWSLTSGPALWHIAMAMPWLLILVLSRRSPHPARQAARTAAGTYLVVVPALAALLWWWASGTAEVVLALVYLVAPTLTVVWCRRVRGDTAFGGRMPWLCAGLAVLTTAAACALAAPNPLSAWPLALGGLAAAAAVTGSVLLVRRRDWLPAAFLAAALVPGALVVGFLVDHQSGPFGGTAAVLLGLSLAPVLFALVDLVDFRRKRVAYCVAVVVAAVLPFPVMAVLTDVAEVLTKSYPISDPLTLATMTASVLVTVLVIVLGTLLYRMSADAGMYLDPLARAAAISTIVVLAIPARITWLGPVITVLCIAVALQWLLPASRTTNAARLGRISGRVHGRLVRAETWRRLTDRVAREVYRTGHTRAASGDVRLSELREIWSSTVDSGAPRGRMTLAEAALGSGGGQSPRRNLQAGLAAATVLALPMMGYEAWLTFSGPGVDLSITPTLNFLDDIRRILRWVVYGGLFGLFYPAIRGERPVVKAGFLLLAIGIPELLAIVAAPYSTPQAIWFAAGIRLGQVTVLCIGLGLFWEWRLSRAAQLRWSQLRDFRSAAALFTPVATVLVAAMTTIATVLAGAAVSAILNAPPSPPAPSPRPETVQQR